jgi:hypothetical protein
VIFEAARSVSETSVIGRSVSSICGHRSSVPGARRPPVEGVRSATL